MGLLGKLFGGGGSSSGFVPTREAHPALAPVVGLAGYKTIRTKIGL
jgi:hypothetical protein